MARLLHLSRAAISQHIDLFGQELGVKLIGQTMRRLKLTEAEALYYAQCERLFDLIDEMEALASTMRQEPRGSLKFFCSRYYGNLFRVKG